MGVSKIHSIFTERREFNDWASHPWKRTRLKKDVMSDLPEKMLCWKRCLLFWTSNDCPLSSSEFYTTDNFINLWPVATPPVIPISAWDAGNLPRICKAQGVHCPRGNGSCMMPSSRGPNSRWNSRKHKRATWLKHSSWAQLQWTLISLWCLWKCCNTS